MLEKLTKIFAQFQNLKSDERKWVLCSIIGCIHRNTLSTLLLTIEPLNYSYHTKCCDSIILDDSQTNPDDCDTIEETARIFVDNVIQYSLKLLKTEYLGSKSFDRFLLDENDTKMISDKSEVIAHNHSVQLPKGPSKIRRDKSIFAVKDIPTDIVQLLASDKFKDDERKQFITEVLFADQFDIQLHICLCVKKRLEYQWHQDNIPENILQTIFRYLSSDDLMLSSLVCKRWLIATRSNDLWKYNCSKYAREIGLTKVTDVIVEQMDEDDSTIHWFEIYKTFRKIFSKYEPKKMASKTESLTFFKETLSPEIMKTKRKPKTVRLSPIKHECGISTNNSTLRHSSRSNSQLDPNPDNDKRQLMKPILGQLKRFQNSDEFAVDCKSSRLNSLIDTTNRLESKINLKWIEENIEVAKTGKIKNPKYVKKMVYIDNCYRLTGHLDGVTSLKCDNVRLVSSSLDGTLRMWDAVSGRSIRKMVGHKGGVYCLDFNEQILVSGGWDMSVIVWSLQPNFNVLKILYGHKDSITAIKIIEHKQIIVSASMDGTVRLHNTKTFKLIRVINFQLKFSNSNGIRDMRVSNLDNTIATAHNDRSIRITDIDNDKSTYQVGVHTDMIRTLFFQSHLLISGGNTGYLQFWEVDITDLKCISKAQIQIKTDSNLPLSIEFIAHYSKSLWTGHDDGTVKEWHLGSMTCLRTIMGHKASIKCICFLDDKMVTASLDSTIRMWTVSMAHKEDNSIDKYGSFREKVSVASIFK